MSDNQLTESQQAYASLCAELQRQIDDLKKKPSLPQALNLARRFHETYERLAPSFGYETRKDSAVPWEKVPEKNKALMVAVCSELLFDQSTMLQALNLVVHKCSADPTNVLLNERAEIWREELEKNGIPVVWNAEQERFA